MSWMVRNSVSCRRWEAEMDLDQPVNEDHSHFAVDLCPLSVQVRSWHLHLQLQFSHVEVDLLGVLTT